MAKNKEDTKVSEYNSEMKAETVAFYYKDRFLERGNMVFES